jgi:hypothetical protein
VRVEFDDDAAEDVEEALSVGIANGLHRVFVPYAKEIAPVDTGTFMRSIGGKMVEKHKAILGSSDKPGKVWALEDGHSDQAPNGVFGPTARRRSEEFKEEIRDALKSMTPMA